MAWTPAEVKAADAALSPPVPDPAQAAAALNAQTVTQPFRWKDAKRIAREAATGDWSRIVARARLQPNLPPTTLADQAILAAINAVESADDDMIDPNDPASWQAFQGGISALSGVGDLAAATVTALNGLPVTAKWQPAISDQDLISIRSGP